MQEVLHVSDPGAWTSEDSTRRAVREPRSSALAAASGTGGGSIFVPVLISFSYLQESAVVALSQFMILVGALIAMLSIA